MVGGYDGSNRLDSTEIYGEDVNVWRTVADKLPHTQYMSITFIGNRVLLFGEQQIFKLKK